MMLAISKSQMRAVPSPVMRMFPWAQKPLSVQTHCQKTGVYSQDGYHHVQYPTNEGTRYHKQRSPAIENGVSWGFPLVTRDAYQ